MDHARRLKEDSTLLLRGFDSVAQSLSQLSNNLETALEVTRQIATLKFGLICNYVFDRI